MHPLGEKWKSMRYQREDEPLWGQQEVLGSSIGFSGRGRADPNESSKYYIPCVPPVNDLHPPIVSGPCSRADTRWMLQPPPSARVMSGKEDFPRQARGSVGGSGPEYLSRVTKSVGRGSDSERIISETGDGTTEQTTQKHLPRRPSLTRVRLSNDGFDSILHSRVNSLSSDANTDPSLSWKNPETPKSRPQSKATDEKMVYRPQISKTLSTMQRDTKKVHMLHLEINDEARDDFALGQLQPIRPWRWSMDI